MSYIDIRHADFLPPRLTIGEARDLGKRYTCSNELAPLQDESTERVSRRLQELAHKAIHEGPIQEPAHPEDLAEPEGPTIEAEQFIINLLATESFPHEGMVTRKTLTIDRFILGARQVVQPPPSQSQVQAPPPPPPPQSGQVRKRKKFANRGYHHSRATDPGRVEYHFLLSVYAGVEAQVFIGRQASTFDRLCADVGER